MPAYHRLRLPDAYRALTSLTARDFAWEWLRRNPDFRALWSGAGAASRRASADAERVTLRSRRLVADIPLHPDARRWTHWGVGFRPVA